MIYGIGVDVIEIERIQQVIERTGHRFVERVYTDAEQALCQMRNPPYACYAARFTAKEAFLKALGTGLRKHMRWRDIEVHRDALGKPSLRLYGALQTRCTSAGLHRFHLSLSHSASYAIAHVLIEC